MTGMDGVDPRFDPRFQRGYDAAPGGGAAPAPTGAPVEASRFAPQPAPTPAPAADPVVPIVVARPSVAAEATAPAAALAHAPEANGVPVEFDDDAPAARRRNPFAIALPVVSVGFLLLGMALIWLTVDGQLSGQFANPSAEQRFMQNLAYIGSSASLIAGGVGLVVSLLLFAITWRGGR